MLKTVAPNTCSCTLQCCALQALQFKTDQQADVRKFEKLTNLFFALMATGDDPPASELLLWANLFVLNARPPASGCFKLPTDICSICHLGISMQL